MSRYAELHCHTNFSFLDGASHPRDLVERAADLGYEALAITDHDGFYGAARFRIAAAEVGLPTVYGVEVGLPRVSPPEGGSTRSERSERRGRGEGDHSGSALYAPSTRLASPSGSAEDGAATSPFGGGNRRGRTVRSHGAKPISVPPSHHLVLLAPDPAGYAALSRLVTRAQFRGEKDRPVYDYEDLAEASQRGGLVALTGCHRGAVPAAAACGDLAATVVAATRLRELFPGRLFVEVWHHRMPGDDLRNDVLAEAAARLRLPLVATNNVHYHDRAGADLAEVLAAVGGRRDLDTGHGYWPATDERYLKAPTEMVARMRRYPGAVRRAADLGAALAFDLRLVAPRLPDFPMPGGFRTEMEYLRHLVMEGARRAYPGDGPGAVDPAALERIEHELGVIEELGFPGYFLVVWDLVRFAESRDILCQIRGSGADSAVCRCLEVTRVDPIRLGLPFERFLSAERGRPPDIDVDFEADRREEVIQYCYRRYGRERAAMVANVITYRARSVLQDVGKAFGLTQAQVNGLTRFLDTRDPGKITEHVDLPEGRTAERILEVCRRLDGFPRHLGIHSGGMVIAERPLWETVPLEWGRMEDRSVLQWDKDDCASMGIVKFDLLALGMLNALHLTVDYVEETHGVRLDLAALPQEPVVYEMLTKADTVGVFQVESRAQMATLPRMKPRTFYDLAVEVALIRPGPIQGHSVHPYLRRRNGEEPVRYPHPLTEPILGKTLGVPVFQEQLMEIARVCAGYTPGQSDRLRQAMTHKRSDEEMEKLRAETHAGMAGQGITGAAADEIWEKLQGFASFGFPESHSVSFAYIVYMSAWLKYHWPAEFLAGLLNAQPMGFYSPNTLVQDAARHGVVVLRPDVNESDHDCTVVPREADPDDTSTYHGMTWRRGRGARDDPLRMAVAVRMGLRYVRGLGEAEIARVEAARLIGGPFASAVDLAQRTGLPLQALEGLAASGALESLGVTRREGLWAAGALAGIGPGTLPLVEGAEAPALPDMPEHEAMRADLWATGVSVRHPVEFIRNRLRDEGCLTVAEASNGLRAGARVRVGGVVTHRQRPGTSRGVIFINLEDETGLLNVIVMPDVWQAQRHVARRRVGLVIDGTLEHRDGVTNLIARRFSAWPVEGVRTRDWAGGWR
jgi:error-prone DNA polymerase